MSDYIVRATAGNGSIRAFAATTRDLVQHAREVHHTSPVASAALGRMLTAAAMMGKGNLPIKSLERQGYGRVCAAQPCVACREVTCWKSDVS